MSDHAVPGTANEPTTRPGEGYFDSPARMKGRRAKPRRFFSKSRLTAVAATAALGVAVGGTAAYAATIPNGPTVQLGTYSIPGSAPQYVSGGDLRRHITAPWGNPAAIVITGSGGSVTASSQVATVPNGSTGQAPGGTPAVQTWYFQRIGYIGATTPAMTSAGGTDMLAVPVYKIINYNTDGTHTCLEAYGVGDPNAGQAAESDVCDAQGDRLPRSPAIQPADGPGCASSIRPRPRARHAGYHVGRRASASGGSRHRGHRRRRHRVRHDPDLTQVHQPQPTTMGGTVAPISGYDDHEKMPR